MNATGTFEITMHPEPPYDATDGVSLARASFDKKFAGALEGTSTVHMLSVRTTVEGSAGYVALERVTGALLGRPGGFVLLHTGLMNRGAPSLSVTVVPDSATGDLAGLSGRMEIKIENGVHSYDFTYAIGETAELSAAP
jgi:hypothetical protein